MHDEAWSFLSLATAAYRPGTPHVLDIGSRDINGSPRSLYPYARYTGIDIEPGPGVDIVADAATWEPDGEYDLAICAEVFEHTADWPQIVDTMWRALKTEGFIAVTAACEPRAPHSAIDGGPVREGEYYANVDPVKLEEVLTPLFSPAAVFVHSRGDVYAAGIKCASSS